MESDKKYFENSYTSPLGEQKENNMLFSCNYGDWRDECVDFEDGSKDFHFATS